MSLTALSHAALVTLAGPDYTYPGVSGSSRPPASYRKALRADLLARQGGICPVCGDEAEAAQFNHVVSRGPGVLGFMPLNVFAGCAVCNLRCAVRFGTVDDEGRVLDGGIIPLSAFARPDLIPGEWAPVPMLKALQRTM